MSLKNTKLVICRKCWGMGVIDGGENVTLCEDCRGLGFVRVPMTNADRIRAMTDEELREFLCSNTQCEVCGYEAWGGCELLKWLQMPAEGD